MPLDIASPLSTDRKASRSALDQSASEYLGWLCDPIARLTTAAESDERFALGHILAGVLRLLSGEVEISSPGLGQSRRAGRQARDQLTAWEQAHLTAFEAWGDGRIGRAAAIWEDILIDHPRDIWALRFAHDTY